MPGCAICKQGSSWAYWHVQAICRCMKGNPAATRRILIASIMEEYDRKAWEDLITMCEDAGVDAFEVNFSCPHGMPERRMGMAMGQDCELLQVGQLLWPATWCTASLPARDSMTPPSCLFLASDDAILDVQHVDA